MIPDPRDQPTMKVEDAGRLVGLGRSASYEAANRGELPTIRFGRRLVVPTAALRQLLALDPRNDEGAPDDKGADVITLTGTPAKSLDRGSA